MLALRFRKAFTVIVAMAALLRIFSELIGSIHLVERIPYLPSSQAIGNQIHFIF
jgi:hypothetical protein